jgi:hypothetical protein
MKPTADRVLVAGSFTSCNESSEPAAADGWPKFPSGNGRPTGGGKASRRERFGGREAGGPGAQSGPRVFGPGVRSRQHTARATGNTEVRVGEERRRQPLHRGQAIRAATACCGGGQQGATRAGEVTGRRRAKAGRWPMGGGANGKGSRSRTNRFGGGSGDFATGEGFDLPTGGINREPFTSQKVAPRVRKGGSSGPNGRAPISGEPGAQTSRV